MKTNPEFRPALTPEEWEVLLRSGADRASWNGREHQIAAAALHGQPFGFTWQDVAGLHALADSLSQNLGDAVPVAPLRDLADRIAALLPPP
jgi:hypothetical protein